MKENIEILKKNYYDGNSLYICFIFVNTNFNVDKMIAKKTVAHIIPAYLPITESWIYAQLKHLKSFCPIVLTIKMINQESFPLEDIYAISGLSVFSQAYNRVFKKFWGGYLPYFYRTSWRKGANLLHAHFGDTAFWHGVRLKKKLHLPMVTTFYGYDVTRFGKDPLWKDRYRNLFAEGEIFLVEGNKMRQRVLQLGCPDDKIIVNHLGIDLKQYRFINRFMPESKKVTILMCSSFREKKGIEYGLKAFANLTHKFKNIKLCLIGDGELRREILSLISNLNINEKVAVLGYQSAERVKLEMETAQIFLHPSVTASDGDAEGGAPVILIEAQAMGLPIVSSYHDDIPEVVIGNKTGLLCPERDIDCLTEKLEYLLQHSEVWPEMGKVGRSHVEINYNIQYQIENLERVYSLLIKKC